jgi:NAD(P)-dependent dehydrogenase (short-subunit alcohol dehydrogenase family)
MRFFDGKIVALTGAGSGIGRALALDLAERGATLALADRNAESLAETAQLAKAGTTISQHTLDVADEAAVGAFADAVRAAHGGADIVINNAGVAIYGSVMEVSTAELRWLMDINFYGVVFGVRAFLPMLLERPEATIVNVSSLFGLWAPAGQSAYAAAKFAVRGYSESLRGELSHTNVHVVTVHPAGVATAIARTSRIAAAADRELAEKSSRSFDKLLSMPPEEAAAIILKGIERKDDRVLVGSDAVRIDLMTRLLGPRAARILNRRVPFDPARDRRTAAT